MTTTQSPLEIMRRSVADWQTELGELDDRARDLRAETRGADRQPTASEARMLGKLDDRRTELRAQVQEGEERVEELADEEKREANACETRRIAGTSGVQTGGWSEPVTYRRGGGPSFFKDLRNARLGDFDAIGRLGRNQAEAFAENRALGNTGAAGGSGGEFAPPAWLVEDFVKLARASRTTANLLHRQDLPAGVSSVNIPKVATGTTVAAQTTQNTALSQTDMTTNSLSSDIVTIGGKQVLSLQLVEQSAIPFDEVVLGDLAAAYAGQLNAQVISGTGTSGQLRGLLGVAGTTVTYTSASPSVTGAGGLYQKMAQLAQAVQTSRFLPITAWIMTPARWAWIASSFDSQGRPLVTPSGPGFNNVGTADSMAAEGKAGEILGVPVYVDPSIPSNLGAGTNQDVILGLRADDCWLWESPLKAESFDAPYSDSMGLLVRCYAYSAAIPNRYPAAIGTITGTGLTAPTFS